MQEVAAPLAQALAAIGGWGSGSRSGDGAAVAGGEGDGEDAADSVRCGFGEEREEDGVPVVGQSRC